MENETPNTNEAGLQEAINVPQSNDDKWCFAWLEDVQDEEPGTQARATLLKAYKWIPGSTITISFLDGDPEVQNRIKKVAKEWVTPGPANLVLDFRKNTNKTDIRISFKYTGSWSMIGTSCKNNKDLTQPTMNYGWLTKSSTDEELRRVVLHEFGHALGLTHEHMNPAGGIKWNKKQVEKDLAGPPNNWTPDKIFNNMFRTFEKKETNFTAVDAKSIMMYPIPAKWTTDGSSIGLNSELSETDKKFIRQQYS